MQTQGYVSRFEPLFYVPAFAHKDFCYVHTKPSTKGPPLRNYNSNWEYTAPFSNTITFTQEGRHKAKEKSLQLGDPMITNSLGDLKGSQIIFLSKTRSYR